MADRMAVLKDGLISQLGTPRELYDHPQNRFTGSFLGDINFVEGKVIDGQLQTSFGTFPLAGDVAGAECGAIRPERIRVVENSHSGAFAAEIIRGTYLGESAEWLCRAGNCELVVKEFASIDRKAGDKIFLAFDSGSLLAMK